jgi:hypothetical protein
MSGDQYADRHRFAFRESRAEQQRHYGAAA